MKLGEEIFCYMSGENGRSSLTGEHGMTRFEFLKELKAIHPELYIWAFRYFEQGETVEAVKERLGNLVKAAAVRHNDGHR